MSRVGNKTIPIPEKVTLKVDDSGLITVDGPKGTLNFNLPLGITLTQENGIVTVARSNEDRRTKALHGTSRALVNNMFVGVSQGFVKSLEIIGVGFRASVKGSDLDLSLGYSHPLLHPIPSGIKVTVTDNTKIKVEGIDKHLVGQFAADVRSYYPPEPYKGKGVRYTGEQVRRKQGKTAKK